MTNNYKTQESERLQIIQNWLGSEGLRFMQTLKEEEQEKCGTSMGLFQVLSEKFKPQHNEKQFCHYVMLLSTISHFSTLHLQFITFTSWITI